MELERRIASLERQVAAARRRERIAIAAAICAAAVLACSKKSATDEPLVIGDVTIDGTGIRIATGTNAIELNNTVGLKMTGDSRQYTALTPARLALERDDTYAHIDLMMGATMSLTAGKHEVTFAARPTATTLEVTHDDTHRLFMIASPDHAAISVAAGEADASLFAKVDAGASVSTTFKKRGQQLVSDDKGSRTESDK